jgi:hypothetical protein
MTYLIDTCVMSELQKIVGWVKRSVTQQNPKNVGFHCVTPNLILMQYGSDKTKTLI